MTSTRRARAGTRGATRRRHRSRPVPRWLVKATDLDAYARKRVMLVLSVLSGETPVTDAVEAAGITRAAYYKLETQAIRAMLVALNPLGSSRGRRKGALAEASTRLKAMEAKVQGLTQEKRRLERLLRMTRKSLHLPTFRKPRGLRKVPDWTPVPRWRSTSSRLRTPSAPRSTPTSGGGSAS